MAYSTGADIRRLVGDYCESVKGGTATFTVKGPFAWNDPVSALATVGGCYAIYTTGGALIYVGMSEQDIGKRIARHQRLTAEKVKFWEVNSPLSYDLIPTSHPWDAAGLEVYLTKKTDRQNFLRHG
jgi:hypothetical protein